MRNGKKLLVMEAPLSVGSPTRGTEDAYRALVGTGLDKSGLSELFTSGKLAFNAD